MINFEEESTAIPFGEFMSDVYLGKDDKNAQFTRTDMFKAFVGGFKEASFSIVKDRIKELEIERYQLKTILMKIEKLRGD